MGAKHNLKYHVVLVTRYRRPALRGVEDQVCEAMRHAVEHSSVHIEAMAVEDGNHIHLVLRCTPTFSLSQIVNRLKAMTTAWMWTHQSTHMSRWYWGAKRKLWNGGYWASTVGDVALGKVLDYVKKQQPR